MATIETVDRRARGLRPRRLEQRAETGAFLRRVDWLLLSSVIFVSSSNAARRTLRPISVLAGLPVRRVMNNERMVG